MSFLRAEWRKLAIANYAVDRNVLEQYVPTGTELDLWNDTCYVSLVGFMFVNTKVLGVKFPFHVNFEEANLRFYVKRFENGAWKRGVVFIKEIVPKPVISFVANTVYKEHYETMPMAHTWKMKNGLQSIEYRWKKSGKWNKIVVSAGTELMKIESGSESEFITEHYWGYSKRNENTTIEYEVTHPRWEIYKVNDYKVELDFGVVYGSAFSFLNAVEPTSVMLAEGSGITVESTRKLKF